MILPALATPPCLVSFSGGRDSSAVLAVAARVARREGLPLPVPVSLAFDGHATADESRWQQLVVRHLELPDWERRPVGDRLDFVGPVAQRVLRRHGVLFRRTSSATHPCSRRRAAGRSSAGTAATTCWRAGAGSRSPTPSPAAPAPGPGTSSSWWLALPRRLRVAAEGLREVVQPPPWLRVPAQREVFRAQVEDAIDEPRGWTSWLRWQLGRRYRALGTAAMRTLAKDAGTTLVTPFVEPAFVTALAHAGGRRGPGDRASAMRRLFSGLLPEPVLARADKAIFDDVFWARGAGHWRGRVEDSEDAVEERRDLLGRPDQVAELLGRSREQEEVRVEGGELGVADAPATATSPP